MKKTRLPTVKVPNARTVRAMRAADKGRGKRYDSVVALFKDLGIGLQRNAIAGAPLPHSK